MVIREYVLVPTDVGVPAWMDLHNNPRHPHWINTIVAKSFTLTLLNCFWFPPEKIYILQKRRASVAPPPTPLPLARS